VRAAKSHFLLENWRQNAPQHGGLSVFSVAGAWRGAFACSLALLLRRAFVCADRHVWRSQHALQTLLRLFSQLSSARTAKCLLYGVLLLAVTAGHGWNIKRCAQRQWLFWTCFVIMGNAAFLFAQQQRGAACCHSTYKISARVYQTAPLERHSSVRG
jgi:hypothetical protein